MPTLEELFSNKNLTTEELLDYEHILSEAKSNGNNLAKLYFLF